MGRLGGPCRAEGWKSIQAAVREVRATVRNISQDLGDIELEAGPPDLLHGSVLRYAIMRAISHHYFHIGEIASKRDRPGTRGRRLPRQVNGGDVRLPSGVASAWREADQKRRNKLAGTLFDAVWIDNQQKGGRSAS